MPLPVILGSVARMAGGAAGRKAAAGAGLGEGSIASVGRLGEFLGGAASNSAFARWTDREQNRNNPPGDERR